MNEQADSGSPPPAPPGHGSVPALGGPASGPPASERPIHTTLSMLEDKLRRLEQELAALAAPQDEYVAPPPRVAPPVTDAPAHEPDPGDAPAHAHGADLGDAPGDAPAPDLGDAPAPSGVPPPSPTGSPPHGDPQPLAETPHATLVDEGGIPPPLPASLPPRPPAPSRAPSTSPTEHLGELLRFRDQLDRYARALISDYERLLEHLGAVIPHAAAARTTTPDAPHGQEMQRGSVTVDAGPFDDVAAINELQRALESVESVLDCILITYEDRWASLHVRLTGPIGLVAELRRVPGPAFTVLEAAPERLSLLVARAEGVGVGG